MPLGALALALVLLTLPLAALGQQVPKMPRIGVLTGGGLGVERDWFLQGLRDLGYAEGKNVAIEWRSAEGKLDRLSDLVNELVRVNVDVIVASSNPAIIALRKATSTIPIVMAVVGDPVGAGFVQSLAHPGGNVTGLSNLAEGLSAKRLELLREAVPTTSRIAVLRHPSIPTHAVLFRETQGAADALGVKIMPFDIPGPDDFAGTFESMVRDRAQALIVLPDPITTARRARITELAAKHRLPAMYAFEDFVDAGGLMSYSPSRSDLWRRAAGYADRILKGAKPAELPVAQPTQFQLTINLKAARTLGVTIPPSLLHRADRVLE
jgi:putative ABC transport system substrate-binding protein